MINKTKKIIFSVGSGIVSIIAYVSSTYTLIPPSFMQKINMEYIRIFDNDSYTAFFAGQNALRNGEEMAQSGRKAEAKAAYKEAIEKLEIAANANVPRAMTMLGELLCIGRNGYVAREPLKAKMWLNRASKAGDERADGIFIEFCSPTKK